MANECIPFWEPGQSLTCHANVALTGKRFCAVVANKLGTYVSGLDTGASGGNYVVGLPAARGRVLGVVERDVGIAGKVGVIAIPGAIVPVRTAAVLTAFQEVEVNANGEVIVAAAGGFAVGIAMTGAGSGVDAEIKLYGAPRLL